MRRSAVVYPGEWAVAREDVEDDERLMGEIERTFGSDVKDQVGTLYLLLTVTWYLCTSNCGFITNS